jgi:hypothetical protein
MPHFVKPRCTERRFKVDLDAVRARTPRQFDEARRRIDIARRADRHEGVAGDERGFDGVHMVGHFAEPDDVGAQLARRAATGAWRIVAEVAVPARRITARQAERAEQLAVHVDDLAGAAAFVQVVDILRDDHHGTGQRRLQLRQRDMRRVGRDGGERCAAQVIEALDIGGSARERLGRGDILDTAAFPQPFGAAEGGNTRFSRDSGAGEDDD